MILWYSISPDVSRRLGTPTIPSMVALRVPSVSLRFRNSLFCMVLEQTQLQFRNLNGSRCTSFRIYSRGAQEPKRLTARQSVLEGWFGGSGFSRLWHAIQFSSCPRRHRSSSHAWMPSPLSRAGKNARALERLSSIAKSRSGVIPFLACSTPRCVLVCPSPCRVFSPLPCPPTMTTAVALPPQVTSFFPRLRCYPFDWN